MQRVHAETNRLCFAHPAEAICRRHSEAWRLGSSQAILARFLARCLARFLTGFLTRFFDKVLANLFDNVFDQVFVQIVGQNLGQGLKVYSSTGMGGVQCTELLGSQNPS